MLKRTTLLAVTVCAVGLLSQCSRSSSPSPAAPSSSSSSAPVITAQPASVTVTPGAVATFTVTATGNPGPTYQWRLAGNDLPGATAATYSTAPVSAANDGGSYTVAVSNGIGAEIVSKPAILTVGQAPAIIVQPAAVTVFAPAPATFTVTATGYPLAYQWQDETGAAIPGATSAAFTIPATSAALNGSTYQVVVSGFGAPVTSNAASLTVNTAATITTQPVGQLVAIGAPLNLSVTASGVPATFSYQWYRNGAAITGATSAAYSVAAATLADNGNYYVTVSNGPVTAQSATVPVTVAQVHTVSGQVALVSGGPAAGITLSLNTSPAANATTDANGNYSLPAVPAGNWTITPSAPGLSSVFFPGTATVTVGNADQTAGFQALLGYTVTGNVSYPGSHTDTGPIQLSLVNADGSVALGTVLSAPGAFSIRGVPPGGYTLNASMQLFGEAVASANDPRAAREVAVAGADLAGQDVALKDPAPVSFTSGPGRLIVSPMASGAVAYYRSITALGVEQAQNYIIEWSTSPDFNPIAGFSSQPAQASNLVVLGSEANLTDGTVAYFRVRGEAGGIYSGYTNAPGSITIGARTGGFTVSGTVNFTGRASGPLYVGLLDQTSGQIYLANIQAPGNSQPFKIYGVPAGGDYVLLGFVDQDRNGWLSAGDLRGQPISNVTVAGNLSGQDLDFFQGNGAAQLTTLHSQVDGAGDQYQLDFHLSGNNKVVTSATLLAGPNLMAPVDLVSPSEGTDIISGVDVLGNRPQVGDSYQVQRNSSDGTSEVLTPGVTGVLDAFVQNPQPASVLPQYGTGTSTEPEFTWAAPVNAPVAYAQHFTIRSGSGPVFYQDPDNPGDLFSSAIGSLSWNLSGQPLLTSGTPYAWAVRVRDTGTGNATETSSTFTP